MPRAAGRSGRTLRSSRSSGGLSFVALGSLLSALAMYAIMLVAARTLDASDASTLLVFIGAYQMVTGLLSGATTELSRTMASAHTSGITSGPRVVHIATVVGLSVAALVLVTSPLWSIAFPSHTVTLSMMVVVTALGFAVHSTLNGALSGRARWRAVGTLTSSEAGVRFVLTASLGAIGLGIGGFGAGMAAASFAWIAVVAFSPEARAALAARSDVASGRLAAQLLASIGALTATAILTAGYPLMLGLTSSHREITGGAPLLQAISLTRAPLIIPLTAFQAVLISYFVSHRARATKALLLIGSGIGLVALLGSILAWLIGPWIMKVLFTYQISGAVLALLTLAAGLLAALILSGALCQALGHHVQFLGGWAAACVVAIALLFLPTDLETRTIASLLTAPIVGMALMVPSIVSRTRG